MTEIWGLTGGIAAGKSQAARIFAEAGIPVVDADQIARELSAPGGAAHDAIKVSFGTADRARLRELVFADAGARKELERILHPLIVTESQRRIDALGAPRVLYEAALLVETGRYKQLAGLLVVDAPLLLRRERLIARDGIAPELADRIMSAQTGDAARLAAATAVLANNGALDDLRAAIRAWILSKGW